MQKLRWKREDEQAEAATRERVYAGVWDTIKGLQASQASAFAEPWFEAQQALPILQVEMAACGSDRANQVVSDLIHIAIHENPRGPYTDKEIELQEDLSRCEEEFWQTIQLDLDTGPRSKWAEEQLQRESGVEKDPREHRRGNESLPGQRAPARCSRPAGGRTEVLVAQGVWWIMRPIETNYRGCRFRSRIEARWAVFFDTLGIKWWYEPEGFPLRFDYADFATAWDMTEDELLEARIPQTFQHLDGKEYKYLPDFYLPELDYWLEIKGPTRLERK